MFGISVFEMMVGFSLITLAIYLPKSMSDAAASYSEDIPVSS